MRSRSFSAERRNSIRQFAILFEAGQNVVDGDGWFAGALSDRGEVLQIFQELLVFGNGKNYGGAFSSGINDELSI